MIDESVPPIDIKRLLKKYELRPNKTLGQNFLIDENALLKVVDTAEISEADWILEVGPGLGSLTRYLSSTAHKVIAIELDNKLLPALQETLAPFNNVKIIIGDILELDPAKLLFEMGSCSANSHIYKVVANIPYYITSALIRHLLEAEIKPNQMVLTVQKEVAHRICAKPPNMSLLALSIQVYGKPTIAGGIPASSFYPSPKVDSSVVKIELYPDPLIPDHLLPDFFRLTKAGFSQKRKMLRNTLASGMHWPKERTSALLLASGIDPQRRAQTLSLKEWETLTFNTVQFN